MLEGGLTRSLTLKCCWRSSKGVRGGPEEIWEEKVVEEPLYKVRAVGEEKEDITIIKKLRQVPPHRDSRFPLIH